MGRAEITQPAGPHSIRPHPEGLIFGMPADLYHADPSLGSTSLKALMKGAADFWWGSWMNDLVDDEDDREPAHFRFGAAFHKLVLEGEAAFHAAYAIEPDPDTKFTDGWSALKTIEHLKAYLQKFDLPDSGNKPAHSRSVQSEDPETISRPSGENATALTWSR